MEVETSARTRQQDPTWVAPVEQEQDNESAPQQVKVKKPYERPTVVTLVLLETPQSR